MSTTVKLPPGKYRIKDVHRLSSRYHDRHRLVGMEVTLLGSSLTDEQLLMSQVVLRPEDEIKLDIHIDGRPRQWYLELEPLLSPEEQQALAEWDEHDQAED